MFGRVAKPGKVHLFFDVFAIDSGLSNGDLASALEVADLSLVSIKIETPLSYLSFLVLQDKLGTLLFV